MGEEIKETNEELSAIDQGKDSFVPVVLEDTHEESMIASEESERKRIVQDFCNVARAQGCGFIADMFERFEGLKSTNSETKVEEEKRMLRDQIVIIEKRLKELK